MAKTIYIRESQLKSLSDLKGYVNSGLMQIGEDSHEKTKEDFDYEKYAKEIAKFMENNGLKVFPMPKLELDNKKQNGLFISTGHYEPQNKKVVLYISDRNPKDILRSYAHELVHHAQNLRGDNLSFSGEDNVKDSKELEKLEAEAYLKGNIYFRKWTEYYRQKHKLDESIKFDLTKKETEDAIRNEIKKEIESGELKDGAEMAEHTENIMKKTFGCSMFDGLSEEEIRIFCSIVDKAYEDCGFKSDLTGVKNHDDGVKRDIAKLKKMQINESIDEKLNPDDINLNSFIIKHHLNPRFWKDGHLDSRIRIRLLDIADDFIDYLGIDWVKPDDIVITGSLANYNWDEKYSDIDLHVVIPYKEIDDNEELVDDFLYSKKELWNKSIGNIKIYGFPVECFVENSSQNKDSESGIYSLEKDKWIVSPKREHLAKFKVNKQYIKKRIIKYIDEIERLDFLYNECGDDSYKQRNVYKLACKIWDMIKSERKNGFEKSPNEMNPGNIIFKALRRRNLLEKVSNIKTELYNKMKSLRENEKK